eukprot:g9840.t1
MQGDFAKGAAKVRVPLQPEATNMMIYQVSQRGLRTVSVTPTEDTRPKPVKDLSEKALVFALCVDLTPNDAAIFVISFVLHVPSKFESHCLLHYAHIGTLETHRTVDFNLLHDSMAILYLMTDTDAMFFFVPPLAHARPVPDNMQWFDTRHMERMAQLDLQKGVGWSKQKHDVTDLPPVTAPSLPRTLLFDAFYH